MVTVYLNFNNLIQEMDDTIDENGTFAVLAHHRRYKLLFRHTEGDQFELYEVKDVVRDITYTATSTEYNLKEVDLQTNCGYGNIISFKREVALDILGLPETYIIAVEPVYLKQGEFCYFKSKTGIIYRIENVKGKYQVFNEKSTETQKATKEIMEKIVLVEKPKKNC